MGHLRERPIRRQQVFEEAACRRPLIPDDYMLLNKQWVARRQSLRPSSRGLTGHPVVYVSQSWTKACVRGQRVLFLVKINFCTFLSTQAHSNRLVAAVTAMYNTQGYLTFLFK